jgi:Protein of unknown function (DUF4012)
VTSQSIEPGGPPAPRMPEFDARPPASRRTKALWIIGACLVLLLGAIAFVSVRALLAKADLEAAIPLASRIQDQVVADDAAGAEASARELKAHTESARGLTSDPVWRAFELVPLLGPNLSASREIAAVVDDIAQQAAGPLTAAAGTLHLSEFKPVEGRFNLQPFADAEKPLAQASAALSAAKHKVDAIDTSAIVPSLQQAASDLRGVVGKAANAVDTAHNAARLVPVMLGATGPRNYLLIFQNPAELRASGGLPGALALLHTDNGQISLSQQASTVDLPRSATPVLALPPDTRALYGDITAQYIQDVNLTPDFPLSARIAQEMWRQRYGQVVDGVLAIDPVALSYILKATGPIRVSTGDTLSADNAVKLLLTDVYARYPDPEDQDGFFATATTAVFTTVAAGNVDPLALIKALGQAGAERRVLLWSAQATEQSLLANTTLSGALPVSDKFTTRFGVYLNDMTGAKMGVYLGMQTTVGQANCRADQRPNYAISVTLTNNAPADAANSLSPYVTGGGAYGVPAGNVKTLVAVYAPEGMQNLGVIRDGQAAPAQTTTDSGYAVSNVAAELAPGQSTTLRFEWLGAARFDGSVLVQGTPSVSSHEATFAPLDCDSAATAK